MNRYGYMKAHDPQTGALTSEQYYITAIKKFQRMAGINETGMLLDVLLLFSFNFSLT